MSAVFFDFVTVFGVGLPVGDLFWTDVLPLYSLHQLFGFVVLLGTIGIGFWFFVLYGSWFSSLTKPSPSCF